MAEDGFKMQADKKLERQIQECTNPDELRQLLHDALDKSGIAARDEITGQYVRREPLTPANQNADAEPEQITRTEKIGGREITFTGTELEVEQQVVAAFRGADAAKAAPTFRETRAAHFKSKADREREIVDRTELDIRFRRGELTTQEYLEQTNAIGTYLAEKGFDVEAAAGAQYQKSWAEATEQFLASSDWPGGDRNREQLGLRLIAMGLTNAEDKVAALNAAYKSMQESNALFDDVSAAQANKLAENASPQEILQSWKESLGGDSDAANANFIKSFQGGRSGIFDK